MRWSQSIAPHPEVAVDWSRLPFRIVPMTTADIPAVEALEKAAYAGALLGRNYYAEIERNPIAHYAVLRVQASPNAPTPASIIGVASYWLIADEAHVITVATAPDWQGLGLGEWQLLSLIDDARSRQARVITLEVRPSNQAARSLYQKYRFEEQGRRPGYYDDSGEDALILTTPPISTDDYQQLLSQRRAALLPQMLEGEAEKQ